MTHIDDEFVDQYRGESPDWGWDGLGEIVYKRTYARETEAGREDWVDTVERVINGAIDIGTKFEDGDAERLFDYVFNLKCSLSGRALWQLGTPMVDKWGLTSLVNCYVTSIESVDDFVWTMLMLMHGGGVGFSIERSLVYNLPKVKKDVVVTHERTNDADYIVPDSREGWTHLLRQVLDAYLITGKSFTYSTTLVRPAGAKLETFGGTASGPGVLVEGMSEISDILSKRAGKKVRSVDALDILNIIGKIVVAGSARRSAQIAGGDPDDHLFLKAKRWGEFNIPAYRANSNNSIIADSYDEIPPAFWKNFDGNSEPYGLINRELMRTVGRTGEKRNDKKIVMANPCVTGSTLITRGTDLPPAPISELVDLDGWWVATFAGERVISKPAANIHSTGINDILRVTFRDDTYIDVTHNHKFVMGDYSEKRADEVIKDDMVIALDGAKGHVIFPIKVVRVEERDPEETYTMTVEDTHTYFAAGPGSDNYLLNVNCGEIGLESREACNLATIYLPNIDSFNEMVDVSRLLYLVQKQIATLPHPDPVSNDVIRANLRLGQSVTGIMQSSEAQLDWLSFAYDELLKLDHAFSDANDLPRSIKLTSVQPSGTQSLVGGTTPGVHADHSEYYIRRVRFGTNDPLADVCAARGYPIEYDVNIDGTQDFTRKVVSFPAHSPTGTVLKNDLTAIEHLEWVARMQAEWADNAVSVTVTYREDELPDIKEWLKENYETKIKSVSFLKHEDHGFALAPYEEISQEQYESMVSDLDFSADIELGDDEAMPFGACEGGACPVR